MMKKKLTPYQRHKAKWSKCGKCELAEHRKNVVLCRGKLPADILFIGEAPGASEDVIGRPFVGPTGKLLDRIIEVSLDGQCDYALTNLVACMPTDNRGKKSGEPSDKCIKDCKPRLQEIIELCNPSLVVCVGKLACLYVPSLDVVYRKTDWVEIIHPAAILRMDESQKPLAIKRCVVAIEQAIHATFGETPF